MYKFLWQKILLLMKQQKHPVELSLFTTATYASSYIMIIEKC